MEERVKVLFVCMGNICRSPTAEGMFRKVVEESGFGPRVHIESAGTHGYHVGCSPDRRAQRAAVRRGVRLGGLRARLVSEDDFALFDLILAMDRENLSELERRAPAEHRHKVQLFLEYAGVAQHDEVPDPYYGGEAGFELVLDLVEQASRGLLERIRGAHLLR